MMASEFKLFKINFNAEGKGSPVIWCGQICTIRSWLSYRVVTLGSCPPVEGNAPTSTKVCCHYVVSTALHVGATA